MRMDDREVNLRIAKDRVEELTSLLCSACSMMMDEEIEQYGLLRWWILHKRDSGGDVPIQGSHLSDVLLEHEKRNVYHDDISDLYGKIRGLKNLMKKSDLRLNELKASRDHKCLSPTNEPDKTQGFVIDQLHKGLEL